MPEPREKENSVLFSLKELQRLEDERVRKEEDERRARMEAERRAREEAERRARDEAERRRQEEEDRVRRIEDERVAQEREGNVRVQEAERRARVEGEMRLAEERMRLDFQTRKQAKAHLGPFIGIGIGLLVIAGGIIWKIQSDNEAERARVAAEKVELELKQKRREDELQKKYAADMAQLKGALDKAQSEEAKARIRQAMEAAAQRETQRRSTGGGRKETAKPAEGASPTKNFIKPEKRAPVDDDPLGGLKL